MYRLISVILAAAVIGLTSGCATVSGSSAQTIAVETRDHAHESVADANCRLTNSKGTWFVRTPGSSTITRSNDVLQVNCDKAGHPSGSATAVSATRGAMFGNIILGGVIGAVIDHSTGSAYEYSNIIRVIMGSSIAVGPPDLSGDGQAPPAYTPLRPSNQATTFPSGTAPAEAVASAAPSVASIDPSLPQRMPQVGDTWKYRYTDHWTNLTKGPIVHQITAISDKEIREYSRVEKGGAGGGEQFFSPDPEFIEHRLSGLPEFAPYLQAFDRLEKPGYWQGIPAESGYSNKWVYSGQVVGREMIVVPAGTFNATRVELNGSRTPAGVNVTVNPQGPINPIRSKIVLWYAPEVKRVVKYTRNVTNWNGRALDKESYELVEYKLNQ